MKSGLMRTCDPGGLYALYDDHMLVGIAMSLEEGMEGGLAVFNSESPYTVDVSSRISILERDDLIQELEEWT